MFDWKRTPYTPFFAIALLSMVFAIVTEGQVSLVSQPNREIEVKVLFYTLAIGCFVYGAIYRWSLEVIYSKRWIWFHLTSVILSLLVIFIVQYNTTQLSALNSGNAARVPFDDLLYLRVQHWSERAFLTLLIAQLILPVNLLLGWYKYRSDNMAGGD